jgi:hypothetical protein
MKTKPFFLLAFALLMIGTVSAQKTWEKPMQKWNKEDTIKILNLSPWVQNYQSIENLTSIDKQAISQEQSNLSIRGLPTAGNSSSNNNQPTNVSVPVIYIRLYSALPVRQALVRLQQIEAGYEKMDTEKRTQFDNAMKTSLECPLCQNYYIVTMAKAVKSNDKEVEDGLFQTMKNEQMKGNVWLLNDKGDKLELAQFMPPKSSADFAYFFFKRKDANGNSFLTPENQSFKFAFNGAFLGGSNPYSKLLPPNFEFKISSLLMNGNLIF